MLLRGSRDRDGQGRITDLDPGHRGQPAPSLVSAPPDLHGSQLPVLRASAAPIVPGLPQPLFWLDGSRSGAPADPPEPRLPEPIPTRALSQSILTPCSAWICRDGTPVALGILLARARPPWGLTSRSGAPEDQRRRAPQSHRQVRGAAPSRRRRHGVTLPGPRPWPRPPRRHQTAERRVPGRPGASRAVHPRGPVGRATPPRKHHHRLRHRRGGRPAVHGNGVHRGRHARAGPSPDADPATHEAAVDGRGALRGTRTRPRRRHHSPRHQAGQPDDQRRGRAQDPRLRHRAPGRLGDDAGRHDARDGQLHEPGAGGRAGSRPSQRHLRNRRRAVRAHHARTGVSRPHRLGCPEPHPQ